MRDYEEDMRRVARFVLTNICCYIEQRGVEDIIFSSPIPEKDDVNHIIMQVVNGVDGRFDMTIYSDDERSYARTLLNDLPTWMMKNIVEPDKSGGMLTR